MADRIFSGPLFCHVCGLPAVPFGGEDICLDPSHEDGADDLDEKEWRRRNEEDDDD